MALGEIIKTPRLNRVFIMSYSQNCVVFHEYTPVGPVDIYSSSDGPVDIYSSCTSHPYTSQTLALDVAGPQTIRTGGGKEVEKEMKPKFNIIGLCFLAAYFSVCAAKIMYGEIGSPYNKKLMMHGYPEKRIILNDVKDGASIFAIHKPGIGAQSTGKELSFESIKYPGYFIAADAEKKFIKLLKADDEKAKVRATFREHIKVRTGFIIFSLEGHLYEFVCNEPDAPYPLSVMTDDNSKYFADKCSFGFFKLTNDQANKKLKHQTGRGIEETKKAGPIVPARNKTEPGKYVRLFLPGVAGINPTLGIKANLFQRVRIAVVPDQFVMKSPGLNGVAGTYSLESVKYPMFYLQRSGRDIYLESMKRNREFYDSATFHLKPYITGKNTYFIHPYNQPEWFIGHLHEPPFYVRVMFNNNTAEFDLDSSWILQFSEKKEIIGLGNHHDLFAAIIKLLSLVHGPLSTAQETAIFQTLHGNVDVTGLGNSTAIMQLLENQHNSLLLSQLATVNSLQGGNTGKIPDTSVMSDATSSASTSAGSTGAVVTDTATQPVDPKPSVEVVTEKYEPWSDWSECNTKCGSGSQIRVKPCKVAYQDACTPIQQSQPCQVAVPCATAQIVTQPQVAQTVQAVTSPQFASTPCRSTCSLDCDPASCPLSCCASNVRKSHITKIGKKNRRKNKKKSKN
eukprot:gene14039-15499_t